MAHIVCDDDRLTRETLWSRLKDVDDQVSWKQLFDKYWRPIHGVARQAGLTDGEAQDVVQEVLLHLWKSVRDKKADPARPSFKGLIWHTTRWKIPNQFRMRSKEQVLVRRPDDTRLTDPVAREPDPLGPELETMWDREWKENLVHRALDGIRDRVSPKNFQVYDCYAIKQWSARDVAECFGMSVGYVFLVKHRVGKLLRTELDRLRAEESL